MSTNHIYLIYMYKPDLALNNLEWLICHQTKSNQTKLIFHIELEIYRQDRFKKLSLLTKWNFIKYILEQTAESDQNEMI